MRGAISDHHHEKEESVGISFAGSLNFMAKFANPGG